MGHWSEVILTYDFQSKDRLDLQYCLDKPWILHYHCHLGTLQVHLHIPDTLKGLGLGLKLRLEQVLDKYTHHPCCNCLNHMCKSVK